MGTPEDEDLELLLSMQSDDLEDEAIPETPPTSPVIHLQCSSAASADEISLSTRMADKFRFPSKITKFSSSPSVLRDPPKETFNQASTLGYCSDEDRPKPTRPVNMGAFKDVVKDSLEKFEPDRLCRMSTEQVSTSGTQIEKFSGLRIKDRVVSFTKIHSTLADVRFVRLQAIKMAMRCEKLTGSWATVGVLVEKGMPKVSTKGKKFTVWKIGTLDETVVTMFLFGAAFTEHWKEPPGTMLAILNANVRLDERSSEPNLSVFRHDQAVKLGVSIDYRVCIGKRKDGTPCTMVFNKRFQGQLCQYHAKAAQNNCKTRRPELSGGKLAVVGPGIRRGYATKPVLSPCQKEVFGRPLKQMTSSDLRDLLSNSEKMPTKSFSQGKRFLVTMAQRTSGSQVSPLKVKRQIFEETNKTGRRVPLSEDKANVDSSQLKPVPLQATKTWRSKSNDAVMEIDLYDDCDDSMPQVHTLPQSKRLRGNLVFTSGI